MSDDWDTASKPTTQETILKAVGNRLMTALPSVFGTDNVRYTLDPEPELAKSHNLTCTITPMEGTFDQEAFDGAAEHLLIEHTGVIIAVWTRQVTDQAGKADHLLFGLDNDKTRALLRIKLLLLKTFTGRMLTDPNDDAPILTELMAPVKAMVPRFANDDRLGKFADISVGFTTAFEWDLESKP